MVEDAAIRRRPGGRTAQKRQALLDGARTVFAREGFARASVDEIATAAGISNRTVYSHFPDKAALFTAVITDSATEVANRQIAVLDRLLAADRPDLRRFATEWVQVDPAARAHFDLVRQVRAEAQHIPLEVLRAWTRSGPVRVHAALSSGMAELSRRGLLRARPPGTMARHFVQLVDGSITERSVLGSSTLSDRQTMRLAGDGIDAFLAAYATPAAGSEADSRT